MTLALAGPAPRIARAAPAQAPTEEANELLADAAAILAACDTILGSATFLLAVSATAAACFGLATVTAVLLLWAVPGFNLSWSILTKRRNKVWAEGMRATVSLPITTAIYMTSSGLLRHFWFPSVVMVVGQGLIWGMMTRRSRAGYAIALGYALTLFMAGVSTHDGPLWLTMEHAMSVLIVGGVVSLVAAHLGRSLCDVRRQRDQAEANGLLLETVLHDRTLAQERLDAVLDCAPALILAVDTAGDVVFINRALPELQKGQALGASWLDLVPEQQRPELGKRFAQVLATGQAQTHELSFSVAQIGNAWYAMHMGAMRSGDQIAGAVIMLQEVTELKRTQAEFSAAQKLAAVGTLAAGIAHEINTPIQFINDSVHFLRDAANDTAAVMLKMQMLQHAVERGAPRAQLTAAAAAARERTRDADIDYIAENFGPAFARCIDGLERVTTIVRSMKEFAHPAGKDKAAVDLNHAVKNTLIIARNEYKLVADVETTLGELPLVTCYVNDVNQALLNLVVNAAHAIGDAVRGTDRRGLIRVGTRCSKNEVMVTVGDDGTGIPDAIKPRIFEPFFTTKEVGRGTGQGLALAWKAIKDRHGGDLTFESAVGVGTTFTIRLPLLA